MSELRIYMLDTETTGKDAGPDRLVEFGVIPITVPDVENPCEIIIHADEIYESYVTPLEPISFGAMATHHVTPEMLEGAPSMDEAIRASPMYAGGTLPKLVSAHNAEFDRGFIGYLLEQIAEEQGGVAPYWLDTLRLAKHVFPDAEGYSNQSLRYELGLSHPALAPGGAHRAGGDSLTTALLLQRIVRIKSLRELCAIQHTPVALKKMAFGKHRGMAFAELEQGYLSWILRSDLDMDVKHSAQTELKRRSSGG